MQSWHCREVAVSMVARSLRTCSSASSSELEQDEERLLSSTEPGVRGTLACGAGSESWLGLEAGPAPRGVCRLLCRLLCMAAGLRGLSARGAGAAGAAARGVLCIALCMAAGLRGLIAWGCEYPEEGGEPADELELGEVLVMKEPCAMEDTPDDVALLSCSLSEGSCFCNNNKIVTVRDESAATTITTQQFRSEPEKILPDDENRASSETDNDYVTYCGD